MELRQEIAAKQQTSLSPRLYQSMKILRMSAQDLLELMQQELDENPALEIPEPADYEKSSNAAERQLWEDFTRTGNHATGGTRYGEQTASAADLAASPVTLADHLTLQLDLEDLPETKHCIGLALIGSLSEDGYLRDSVDCIADTIDAPVERVESVLAVIQGFDPPGIAARNLEECLLIQLQLLGSTRLARVIVTHCLPEVARNAYSEIARKVDAPVSRVENEVAVIRELNPTPGSLFDTSPPAGAVIPDVFTFKSETGIQVLANRESLPPLKLNQTYKEMAKAGDTNAETAAYIKTKIKKASQLIRDFKQRRATITRVASAIAEEQESFFDRGPAHLRPLTVEDIALKLDVHPSTISRAILGKYMNTPFGILEFRYFFSGGYSRAGGEELSANAVKKRLSVIVARENPLKPLSDQKIAELLAAEQIEISRRTVAKYREEMGTLPSWQRRKLGRCRKSGKSAAG
jgi:RNA polymerase sigma-54 factor